MSKTIISFDLGTGGNKASLYDVEGNCLATAFVPYETHYPQVGWHEQRPQDWWQAVVKSTRKLLETSKEDQANIACLAISGHSLGCVPLDKNGNLLREATPIWSDIRAEAQAEEFFKKVDENFWYMTTGNGFPPACYTIFKVMWYRDHEPEMFKKTACIIGTKDYINFRLTGQIKTDFSYASGSGIYDLKGWKYQPDFIAASGIPASLFPEIVPSTAVLGGILPEVARELGLSAKTQVICGGVDNSCMALGAKNTKAGRVYTSLGSSAWIAVSSDQPVLDAGKKPYVFAHVIPGLFTSAVSIFSAGTSLTWVKDNICSDMAREAEKKSQNPYAIMDLLAEKAPVGSNKLLFNPSLAGGTSQDANVHIRGAYLGIDLKHGRGELIRAAMEGIAMNLRLRLDLLRKYTRIEDEMLLVGGGGKSPLYRRIFADIYNTTILKTNIDQDAAALGAGAIAAVGCGLWDSFDKIDSIHKPVEVVTPDKENNAKYEKLLPIFEAASDFQAQIGGRLREINI